LRIPGARAVRPVDGPKRPRRHPRWLVHHRARPPALGGPGAQAYPRRRIGPVPPDDVRHPRAARSRVVRAVRHRHPLHAEAGRPDPRRPSRARRGRARPEPAARPPAFGGDRAPRRTRRSARAAAHSVNDMTLDLPLAWMLVIGFAVMMYVVTDG